MNICTERRQSDSSKRGNNLNLPTENRCFLPSFPHNKASAAPYADPVESHVMIQAAATVLWPVVPKSLCMADLLTGYGHESEQVQCSPDSVFDCFMCVSV